MVYEVHTRGLAMGLGGQKAVARIAEKAVEGVHAQIQQRAVVQVAGAVDAHLAAGLGAILGHVVVHMVGVDHRVAAAQLGIALDGGADVGLARDAVATHEHRQLLAHLGRQGFLQPRTGAQRGGRLDRRVGRLIAVAHLGQHGQRRAAQHQGHQPRQRTAQRGRHGRAGGRDVEQEGTIHGLQEAGTWHAGRCAARPGKTGFVKSDYP